MIFFNQIKRDDPALRLLFFAILAGLALLAGGLWWVQVVNGSKYQTALESQSFRSVRVSAPRGRILDRNGIELANNRPSYDVSFYLEEMRKAFSVEYKSRNQVATNWLRIQREAKAKALGRPLTKIEAKQFRLSTVQRDEIGRQSRIAVANNLTATLAQKLQAPLTLDVKLFTNHYNISRSQPFTVMKDLQPAQIARFEEQFAGVPGVELDMRSVRNYPFGTTAAHLLGYGSSKREGESVAGEQSFYDYRQPDFKGLIGIEGGMDEKLRGQAGAKSVLINYLGYKQGETILQPTVPGYNTVLTLDVRIQQAAEKALARAGGNTRGAIVVMDTRNGDVLALASSPTYNPSHSVTGFPDGEMARRDDTTLRPQINRATQENYQPGSIFKIVVSMALLENGLDPEGIYTVEPYPGDPGSGVFRLGTRLIKDTAHPGSYNFRRAFIKSSNSYFIHHGIGPGILERVCELGKRLHLGERATLPTRQESPGIFPTLQQTRKGWVGGDTANLSIGQAKLAVTPLQMAVMVSAVANGGTVYWPRLVQRLDPMDTMSPDPVERFEMGRVRDSLGVSSRTLRTVQAAMLADVEDPEGSGVRAAVPGLRIGGKTGTAQVRRNQQPDHDTWFASFGGVGEDRRYAVVVMIESGQSGGLTCAPLAKEVYQAIRDMNLPQNVAMTGRN